MINISVQHDFDKLTASLDDMAKNQVPFALARALNDTADAVQAAEVREMKDVFDRPTPTTLNAVYVKRATKGNLIAEIGLKNFAGKGIPATKYLAAEIDGGSRRLKRFEVALVRAGVMPEDMRAVPGEAAQMDAYGNMLGSQIVQILSFFKAFPELGYKANMSDKRRAQLAKGSKTRQGFAYFVGRPAGGKLPLGIWQRFQFARGSSAIKPVLIFVPHTIYQAVFDFGYVVQKTVDRTFPASFQQRMAEAMATAK